MIVQPLVAAYNTPLVLDKPVDEPKEFIRKHLSLQNAARRVSEQGKSAGSS
jgi:hypothetical protein